MDACGTDGVLSKNYSQDIWKDKENWQICYSKERNEKMKELISTLNKFSIEALQNMASGSNALRLWIENGRITGFMNGDNGKLHKEIPTQTANPSGDE